MRRPLPGLFAFNNPARVMFGGGDFEVVDLEAADGFADDYALRAALAGIPGDASAFVQIACVGHAWREQR